MFKSKPPALLMGCVTDANHMKTVVTHNAAYESFPSKGRGILGKSLVICVYSLLDFNATCYSVLSCVKVTSV